MKMLFIRFMLYMARVELGLATIGGNQNAVRQLRKEVQHWESELVNEQVRIWMEDNAL